MTKYCFTTIDRAVVTANCTYFLLRIKMTIKLNQWQLSQCANLPAEGSDRQPFGFFILELPQREQSALLVPELIRCILKVFEIWKGMKWVGRKWARSDLKVKDIKVHYMCRWTCRVYWNIPCAMSSNVFWLTIRSKILAALATLVMSSFYNRNGIAFTTMRAGLSSGLKIWPSHELFAVCALFVAASVCTLPTWLSIGTVIFSLLPRSFLESAAFCFSLFLSCFCSSSTYAS